MGFKQFAASHGFLHELYAAQNKICYICRKEMPEPDAVGILQCESVTMDHVTSRNKRGGNKGNFLLAHGRCNSSKGNRAPTPCELTYLAIVNDYLGWDGSYYMKTEKGVKLCLSEAKRAQERLDAANAIIVLPINREGAIRVLKSKKYYRRWRWQQHKKRENTLKWKITNVFNRKQSACAEHRTSFLEAASRLGSYGIAIGSRAVVQSYSLYRTASVKAVPGEVVV